MSAGDDDLVPLATAATMADRSVRTLRSWVKAGSLTRWEGVLPASGGSAPVLISKAQLLTWLAASGIQPRPEAGGDKQVEEVSIKLEPATRAATSGMLPPGSEAEVLRVKLHAAETIAAERERRITLEGRLATAAAELEAKLAAANDRANALRLELDRTRSDLVGARSDISEWKQRYDAQGSELAATVRHCKKSMA